MNNYYNYIFIINNGVWFATTRDHYNDLYNNSESPNILKSSSIDTLLELLKDGEPIDVIKQKLNKKLKQK